MLPDMSRVRLAVVEVVGMVQMLVVLVVRGLTVEQGMALQIMVQVAVVVWVLLVGQVLHRLGAQEEMV
tara:strand:- start:131 stop:334 length:204 start_codon:yes stop_codon:yes gene_type:complete